MLEQNSTHIDLKMAPSTVSNGAPQTSKSMSKYCIVILTSSTSVLKGVRAYPQNYSFQSINCKYQMVKSFLYEPTINFCIGDVGQQ